MSGPAGEGWWEVEQGETIESIAFETGFFADTLWDHPANQKLRELRRDRNVLLPGDRVEVPEIQPKVVPCSTGAKHRFRRKGVPSRLRLELRAYGEPRANAAYTLLVGDDIEIEGTTDANGFLEHFVPATAREATLLIGDDEFWLVLGELDPSTEPVGIRKLLRNLGYACGDIDDPALDDDTRTSLAEFQRREGLPATGVADVDTVARLTAAQAAG